MRVANLVANESSKLSSKSSSSIGAGSGTMGSMTSSRDHCSRTMGSSVVNMSLLFSINDVVTFLLSLCFPRGDTILYIGMHATMLYDCLCYCIGSKHLLSLCFTRGDTILYECMHVTVVYESLCDTL